MGNSLLDDHAIEAFFLGTGQSAWTNEHALRTLADDVVVATGGPPPRPHGALLAFLDDAASAPAVAAVPTPAPAGRGQHPAAVAPAATTDRCSTLRLLSRRLRTTAGVAAGIGIAAATLTVAGTTGVLPDPAMRAVSRVVEALTPFELSEPGKPSSPAVPPPPPATASSVPAGTDPGPGAVGAGAPTGPGGPSGQPAAITPPAGPPGSVPPNGQAPAQPGSTGLDRAGQTPAAPFIPPLVPGGPAGPPSPPTGDGSGAPGPGVDRARETPAGTFIPPVAGGPPSRR